MSEYVTTTLSAAVAADADEIKVTSNTGITKGKFIFVDRELMEVKETPASTTVKVRRGHLAGIRSGHANSKTIYIGSADQFFYKDFAGYEASPNQAYCINVHTGEMFFNSAGQWYGSREGWGMSTV